MEKIYNDISTNTLLGFLEFEKKQNKTIRGNVEMYDIKGHYKYLTFSELLNWYIDHNL